MSRPSPPVPMKRRLPPPLIESPLFVLMQTGRLAFEWTADALEPLELTVAQFAVLSVIDRLEPISQVAAAERLGMSEAGMSTIVAGLTRNGLVQRRFHIFDGRRRLLYITPAGHRLVAEAADELEAVEAICLDHITENVCARLAELLPPDRSPVEETLRLVWS